MIAFFNAVNTYTDASILTDDDGFFVSCSGFVTTFHGDIIDSGTKIVYGSTNNHGEVLAIYMGIQSLLSFREYDAFLNLFSDSRISVFGLREWIYGWLKNVDPKTKLLINSSGTKVKNQDIFCNIINYIVENNTHLSIYHQRGHQDPSNVNELEVVRKSFIENNDIELTDDIIREICYYNNVVDNMTRNTLIKTYNSPDYNPLKYWKGKIIAQRVLNQNTMERYKKLIERNG
jgi:ribonuclease HI